MYTLFKKKNTDDAVCFICYLGLWRDDRREFGASYSDKPISGKVDSLSWGVALSDGNTRYNLSPKLAQPSNGFD